MTSLYSQKRWVALAYTPAQLAAEHGTTYLNRLGPLTYGATRDKRAGSALKAARSRRLVSSR
jgi:hypothetical protein